MAAWYKNSGLLAIMMAGVVLLSGCQSSVATSIEVDEDGGADVVVVVEFEGDIKTTLSSDAELRQTLEASIAARVQNFEVVKPGTRYILRPTLDELKTSADLTGIADIAVEKNGSVARVSVATISAQGLTNAITTAVQGEPDAQALAETMIANTFLEVSIRFPGKVVYANGGVTEDTMVAYRDSVQKWATGTLVVDGELSSDVPRWVFGIGGVALLMAAWWWMRRGKR
jgi:hypothetical protein